MQAIQCGLKPGIECGKWREHIFGNRSTGFGHDYKKIHYSWTIGYKCALKKTISYNLLGTMNKLNLTVQRWQDLVLGLFYVKVAIHFSHIKSRY